MKATKKIVGAACALVAAVALSAGSTFAWFTSNGKVTATGLEIDVNTSNTYLVINTAYGALRTDNLKTVTISQNSGNPSKAPVINPSAHIQVGETTDTDTVYFEENDTTPGTYDKAVNKIAVNGLLTESNWYTADGQSTTVGTIDLSSAHKLDDFEEYVIVQDLVVGVATGSDAITELYMKMECEGGWKTTNSTKTNNDALNVVVLYQVVANGGSAAAYTYYTEATGGTGGNGHALGQKNGGSIDLLAKYVEANSAFELDDQSYVKIQVMVYFDGNHADVKSSNAKNLTGVKLNFEFTEKEPTAPANNGG